MPNYFYHQTNVMTKRIQQAALLFLFSFLFHLEGKTCIRSITDTGKHNRLLVLCILSEKDSLLAASIENNIASSLLTEGYSIFTASNIPLPSIGAGDIFYASAAIRERGFTAILAVTLVDKLANQYYKEGKPKDSTLWYKYSSWDNYYNTVKENIYSTHYYHTNNRYAWEYNFYEVPDGTLLFSGRSKSCSYNSRATTGEQFTERIKKAILEKQVLRKEER